MSYAGEERSLMFGAHVLRLILQLRVCPWRDFQPQRRVPESVSDPGTEPGKSLSQNSYDALPVSVLVLSGREVQKGRSPLCRGVGVPT